MSLLTRSWDNFQNNSSDDDDGKEFTQCLVELIIEINVIRDKYLKSDNFIDLSNELNISNLFR